MNSLPRHDNNEEFEELRRVDNFNVKTRRNNNSIGNQLALNRIMDEGRQ